ncbi:cytochrome P450 3A8-like isoform X2 [Centruroides vittatus]
MDFLTTNCSALIIVFFITWMIIWLARRKSKQTLFTKYGIPGPKPHILSGNLFEFKGEGNPNEVFTTWLKKYGKIVGFYIGDDPQMLINDFNIIKHLFVKESRIFINRPKMVLDAWPLNETLLDLRNETWKRVRSVLTPTFSAIKIKQMTEIMNSKVDKLVKLIGKSSDDHRAFDMYTRVQGLTLDVIGHCALAMNTNCQDDDDDPFLVSVREFFKYSNNVAVLMVILFPPLKLILEFINNYLTSGRMTSLTVKNVKKVINYRRKHTEKKSIDLLQLMIDSCDNKRSPSNKYLTDNEMIANAYMFLLAGYETTAASLALIFYLLATHQDIQDRLYEAVAHLKDKPHPSYDDIQDIQYLDQVFNECLRYYPPVTGFIARQCSAECKMDELIIPKGVTVIAPIWEIQHDPRYWKNPWKFDPDRFAPEDKQDFNPSTFFPFGLGPRICIGMRFAQIEVKLAMARVILNYKLLTCEETEIPLQLICPTVIINPKNGIILKAERRKP